MTPFVSDPDFRLYVGDVREVLAELPDGSVDCCVTSPPYWGLRDYGHDGQIGLEASPEAYVAEMVAVFAQVRRVLTPAGTLWLNLGDSYSHGGNGARDPERWPKQSRNDHRIEHAKSAGSTRPKNLIGIPWRVAFALQEDGWNLRSDIIWHKPNGMPESVTDRPTKAHEYLFLLSRGPLYYYDAAAVREPYTYGENGDHPRVVDTRYQAPGQPQHTGLRRQGLATGPDGRRKTSVQGADGSIQHRDGERWPNPAGRNVRSVWTIATQPFPAAHFATFPEALPERCIAAGCPPGGTVLDPFMGSGTTALVARRLGRKSVGIELNAEYAKLAARRLQQLSLLADGDAA